MTAELIVLGTGGTIAGTAASSTDHTGYTAAQISVATLLQGVPGLHKALDGQTLVSEQVAQVDSKDMDFATMLRIAAMRCNSSGVGARLSRPMIARRTVVAGTSVPRLIAIPR